MSVAHMPLGSNYTPASSTVVKSLSGQSTQQSAGASLSGPTESTHTPTQAAYLKAIARASELGMVAYRNADGSYSVPSTSEPGVERRVFWPEGAKWHQAQCDCTNQNRSPACVHKAVALWARENHTSARRPVPAALSEIEERRQQRTALQQRDSAWWADAQARVAAANARAASIFDGQY